MSMAPRAESTFSTRPGMDSGLDRSTGTASDSIPCRARPDRASSSSPCLRAQIATRAPSSRSPCEPPVTRATLPERAKSCFTPMAPFLSWVRARSAPDPPGSAVLAHQPLGDHAGPVRALALDRHPPGELERALELLGPRQGEARPVPRPGGHRGGEAQLVEPV